jgi:hypothetical protein
MVATVAVAAAAGTAVSLAQRPPATLHPPGQSPLVAPTLPSNQPAVAFGFSVAADLASHTLVLFGGVDGFATTWLWNGAAWVRAHPATSPPGRYDASEAFDPQSGEVLLFGGILKTGQPANDTWASDGSTWHEVDAGRGGPAGGAGSDMAWDSALNQVVLVTRDGGAGETWIWNATHWVRAVAGDLGTSDAGIVIGFDPLSNSLMAEGCCQSQPALESRAPAHAAHRIEAGRIGQCPGRYRGLTSRPARATSSARARRRWRWVPRSTVARSPSCSTSTAGTSRGRMSVG